MFSPRQRSTQLREQRAAAVAAMTTFIERAQAEARAINAEESAEFDRREAEVNGIDAQLVRIEAIERAAAGARPIDSGLPGLRVARTMREAIEQSGLLEASRGANFCGRADLNIALRTVIGGGNDGVSSAPTELAPISGEAGVYNRISALIPHVPVSGASMIYNRLKASSDSPNPGAAEQAAQGDLKGNLLIDSDPLSATIKTWAGFEKLSVQVLSDAPAVAAVVEAILRGAVLDLIDAHCVSVLTTGGNYTANSPSGNNVYENAVRIVAQLRARGSTNIVVAANSSDVLTQSLAKASTAGTYLGKPEALTEPGVHFIESASVATGKLIGFDASGNGPIIGDRAAVSASLGLDSDDFTRNLRTMLVEARAVCAVRDPQKVIYGNASA